MAQHGAQLGLDCLLECEGIQTGQKVLKRSEPGALHLA